MSRFRLRLAIRELIGHYSRIAKINSVTSALPKTYFRSFAQPLSSIDGLPASGIGHRNPRLLRRQRTVFLQKLDRNLIRRTDESHVSVSRRPVDHDAGIHQVLAGFVYIVDFECQMAEIASAGIDFRIPVEGQFDFGRLHGF
jgi:hypothetical protein